MIGRSHRRRGVDVPRWVVDVRRSVDALNNVTTSVYDQAGRLRRSVDPNGRITTSLYDNASRPIATINALGNRTTTVYDQASQITALVDANAGRNTFTYDANGRKTQEIDPLNRRTTSAYDNAGRQTLRLDPRSNRTTWTYDNNDRPTTRQYPDNSRATFAWDATGNRTFMQDASGRYTNTWDALGRKLNAMTPVGQRITYAYDALGQRRHMTAPTGGRFTYQYDAAGRIAHLVNPENERTSYAYDAASRRTEKRLANGTRASFTHDAASQITNLHNLKSDGSAVCTFDYRYDATGNRIGMTEADGARVTWTYDVTNQLTAERRSGANAYAHTFAYDPLGNRLAKIADGARTTSAYDAANQLRFSLDASGRTTYTFDQAGNQALVLAPTGQRTTTTWNFENQPSLHQLPDTTRVTASYNPDLQRVEKNSSEGTTKFLWDDQNYLAEADETNAIRCLYTNEPKLYGNAISQRRDGNTSYLHFDALGSTRAATNPSATITDTWLYTAWGEAAMRTGETSVPFAWIGEVGYYFDLQSNSHYARRRLYSQVGGRWLSADPLGVFASRNVYLYCNNESPRRSDPSGLIPYVEPIRGVGDYYCCSQYPPRMVGPRQLCRNPFTSSGRAEPEWLFAEMYGWYWRSKDYVDRFQADAHRTRAIFNQCCIRIIVKFAIDVREFDIETGMAFPEEGLKLDQTVDRKFLPNLAPYKPPFTKPESLHVHYVHSFFDTDDYEEQRKKGTPPAQILKEFEMIHGTAPTDFASVSPVTFARYIARGTAVAHEVGHALTLRHVETESRANQSSRLMHPVVDDDHETLSEDECRKARAALLTWNPDSNKFIDD